MFEIFNSKIRMTGSIIMILMIMVRMNVKCEINYIGFSDGHKLVNNSQQYYWGNRKISNNKNDWRTSMFKKWNDALMFSLYVHSWCILWLSYEIV